MTAKVITKVVFLMVATFTLTFTGLAVAGELPSPDMSITATPTTIAVGETVEVTFSVYPGEELLGAEAEWWIVTKDPTGKKYYLSGGTWYEDPRAYSLANLADFSKTFTSLPLAIPGTWIIYFALDGDKDGVLAGDAHAVSAAVNVGGATVAPTPGITADPTGAAHGTTALLTLTMNSGSYAGHDAEWWVVANSPGGARYYYDGTNWSTTKMYYSQAAMHDIPGITIATPTLAWIGTWTFYFGVDGWHNNNVDEVYYASCTVNVGGGTPATWTIEAMAHNVNPGETTDLDLNLFSGSYTGVAAELWLVAITPAGEKLYHNGTNWTPTTVMPFASGSLVDVDQLIATFPLTLHGTYSFYFGADDDINNAIDKPEWLDVDRVHVSEVPQAFIKANGQSGSLIVAAGSTVELSIALDAGSYEGLNADWWVVGINQAGMSFTYNSESHIWTHGYHTYRQAPLADVSWTPVTSVTLTEPGTYHFYFGVDDPNGYVDMPVYQEVIVYVQ